MFDGFNHDWCLSRSETWIGRRNQPRVDAGDFPRHLGNCSRAAWDSLDCSKGRPWFDYKHDHLVAFSMAWTVKHGAVIEYHTEHGMVK